MSAERNEYVGLLALLLEKAVLANFEYWSEFIVRIQRDEAKRKPELQEWFGARRIPSLFCLRLRSKWWIGERDVWDAAVQRFPMKAAPPMPVETALQASTLIMLLGSIISNVAVDEVSNITINLSDGRIVTVEGRSEDWDESWFLELPVDDPEGDQWSIVCDSDGNIGGEFPEAAKV